MDRLAHDQEQMGYFLLMRDGVLLSAQDGVFRTNCIDCLDRTNVVQSMLAKRVLNEVLSRLEVLRKVEDHPAFENLFKQVNIKFFSDIITNFYIIYFLIKQNIIFRIKQNIIFVIIIFTINIIIILIKKC